MTLSLRVECSPPGSHSILAKATNIGYLFFAKLKVLSSLTKTEIKRPPIYKKCAFEQGQAAVEQFGCSETKHFYILSFSGTCPCMEKKLLKGWEKIEG